MKKLMIAALLSGQMLITAQPAAAADFAATQPERMRARSAAFAFASRSAAGKSKERSAPVSRLRRPCRTRTRGANGSRGSERAFELGYRSGRPLALSVAGMDLDAIPAWARRRTNRRRRRNCGRTELAADRRRGRHRRARHRCPRHQQLDRRRPLLRMRPSHPSSSRISVRSRRYRRGSAPPAPSGTEPSVEDRVMEGALVEARAEPPLRLARAAAGSASRRACRRPPGRARRCSGRSR